MRERITMADQNRKNKLSYRGVVYFYSEDNKGNRILLSRHNAGTLALARFFARSLTIGENSLSDLAQLQPNTINLYDKNDGPVLVLPAPIQNAHVEDGFQNTYPNELPLENYRAFFECTISRTQLRAGAAAKATKVVLLDAKETTLAYIDLEAGEISDIFQNNENLVIIWQMELIYDDIFEEVPDEYR